MKFPQEFQDFALRDPLGEGGMGVVYLAWQKSLEREVAIKFLPHAYDEELKKRFLLEAKTSARLAHPHIVQIYSYGIVDEMPYFAMEYVPGKTLREILKKPESLKFSEIVTYAIQIADALDCAHERGIIHRDIKPGNIMVTPRGYIKVMDFGLAKTKSHFAGLTQSGVVLGTPYYMSPEQAKGEMELNEKADLYSLGVMLFEMVAGVLPFQGSNSSVILYKHIYEDPPRLPKLISNVPSPLSNLIHRCMEKDPSLRYQSARDMVVDLRAMPKWDFRAELRPETISMISPPEEETQVEVPHTRREAEGVETNRDQTNRQSTRKGEEGPSQGEENITRDGSEVEESEIDDYVDGLLEIPEVEEEKSPSLSRRETTPQPVVSPARESGQEEKSPPESQPKPKGQKKGEKKRKKPISRELQELQRTTHQDTKVRRRKKKNAWGSFVNALFYLFWLAALALFTMTFYQTVKREEQRVLDRRKKEFLQSRTAPFALVVNGRSLGEETTAFESDSFQLSLEIQGRVEARVGGEIWVQIGEQKSPSFSVESSSFSISDFVFLIPRDKKKVYDLEIIHRFPLPKRLLGHLSQGNRPWMGRVIERKKIKIYSAGDFYIQSPSSQSVLDKEISLKGRAPERGELALFWKGKKEEEYNLLFSRVLSQKGPFQYSYPLGPDQPFREVDLKVEFKEVLRSVQKKRRVLLAPRVFEIELSAEKGGQVEPLRKKEIELHTKEEEKYKVSTDSRGRALLPLVDENQITSAFVLFDGQKILLPLYAKNTGTIAEKERVPIHIQLGKTTIQLTGPEKKDLANCPVHLWTAEGEYLRTLGRSDARGTLVTWLYEGEYQFSFHGKGHHGKTKGKILGKKKEVQIPVQKFQLEPGLWKIPPGYWHIHNRMIAYHPHLIGVMAFLILIPLYWKRRRKRWLVS